MDGWTLGLLVDYIYTAEIQVTEDNVQVNPHAGGDNVRTLPFAFLSYSHSLALIKKPFLHILDDREDNNLKSCDLKVRKAKM